MRPLERLLETARALPGGGLAPVAALPWEGLPAGGAEAWTDDLGRRVGAVVGALADRLEPALRETLEEGLRAWDRIDALTVIDEAARREIDGVRAALERAEDAPPRIEALLALGTAVGLVELLERRLAALVRLRLAADAPVLPEGRPFLDVAAALREVARRWS